MLVVVSFRNSFSKLVVKPRITVITVIIVDLDKILIIFFFSSK